MVSDKINVRLALLLLIVTFRESFFFNNYIVTLIWGWLPVQW